jgi:hypothetical protein
MTQYREGVTSKEMFERSEKDFNGGDMRIFEDERWSKISTS